VLETLRLLGAPQARGRAALERYQSARLRRLVTHAYEEVPFYRRLFDAHGVKPAHIRGIRDLHLIPVTTRRALQETRAEELVRRGTDPGTLIVNWTSGSTGAPLHIRRTWYEQNLAHLYRLRALRSVGVRRSDRLMKVAAMRPVHARDSKLLGRTLAVLRLQRRKLDVDVLLDPQEIAELYLRSSPQVLSGSPSILLRLAAALSERDRREHRPRVVLSAGEVLAPDQRALLEHAFAAPVRNVYTSMEMGVLAWECLTTGAMHTSDDSVIVEVLEQGRQVQPGEVGDVVATNLLSFAAPLLRYRQGDRATCGRTSCACGVPFGTITEVQGRELDYLTLPDGRLLHPYRLARGFIVPDDPWFWQYQITQERIDRIVLRVVPLGEPSPGRLAEVRRNLQATLGPGVELDVRLVPSIPLEPGGKFRVARSLVGREVGGERAAAPEPPARRA
jgi:phenylacetate-CoA ligase